MREAEIAFEEHRLTTPVEDNAWYRYLRVLTLDEENKAARRGIEDIVEKYLAWAIEDIQAGYLHKARKYLTKVRAIDETHPNIPAVQKLLSDKESTHQQIIKLSVVELDNRSVKLANQLLGYGQQVQKMGARIVIVARNDAEGRWIYQQMNRAEQGARIRARIQLETTPSLKIYTQDISQ
jgi:hypothetical protein